MFIHKTAHVYRLLFIPGMTRQRRYRIYVTLECWVQRWARSDIPRTWLYLFAYGSLILMNCSWMDLCNNILSKKPPSSLVIMGPAPCMWIGVLREEWNRYDASRITRRVRLLLGKPYITNGRLLTWWRTQHQQSQLRDLEYSHDQFTTDKNTWLPQQSLLHNTLVAIASGL